MKLSPTLELRIGTGRELDSLVALQVMGWTDVWFNEGEHDHVGYPPSRSITSWHSILPNYSTDIFAAWEVVERLRELGCADVLISFHEQGGYEVEVNVTEEMFKQGYRSSGASGTAPECICRAALICVAGVKK